MTITVSEATDSLPRWDLESIFPGPDSPELRAAFTKFAQDTAVLESLFDQHGIGHRPPGAVNDALLAVFTEVLDRYNALMEEAMRLDGYLVCLVAADVRDAAAQSAASEWRLLKVGLNRLAPRFTAWAGALDRDELAARSEAAHAHAPVLRRLRTAAAHLMDPAEEDLAAALGPTGASAWLALREELGGRATARIVLDGEERELPLSQINNLAHHPDRDVRRRAYAAERETWRSLAVPLAAALNGVKGQQLTLALRRGWDDPLDEALFANAVDRATLETLLATIAEALPDYRRYLRAKARLLGLPVLAPYDLRAPVGPPAPWPYATAQAFIVTTFDTASPRLGALARRAFAERWIDAGPRPGKDGGAFSMPVGGDQTRILANYMPVYDWMSAIAHELGHSYHVVATVAKGRTNLQAPPDNAGAPLPFPMTLAETASTICEALVQRAARAAAAPAEEVSLLDGWLQALSLNVFWTLPLFQGEREIFARRRRRELSAAELDELMAAAWREVAADAVEPEPFRQHEWTVIHYYLDGTSYYNFPYAFGLLFGLGLLAVYDTQPAGFFERFDDLLADSGMLEAGELAARFGIDLRDAAFWRSGLDTFRADVAHFETLTAVLAPPDEDTTRHRA